MLKLSTLDPKLRERIQRQIRAEDSAVGVAAVESPAVQRRKVPPLARGAQTQARGKRRVAICHVTIISFRRRFVDDDSIVASAKPLRDAIARTLQADDGSSLIRWGYGQVETQGPLGTEVVIST